MNQRELPQDGKYFANLENQLRVVKMVMKYIAVKEDYQMQIAYLINLDQQFYQQENKIFLN